MPLERLQTSWWLLLGVGAPRTLWGEAWTDPVCLGSCCPLELSLDAPCKGGPTVALSKSLVQSRLNDVSVAEGSRCRSLPVATS